MNLAYKHPSDAVLPQHCLLCLAGRLFNAVFGSLTQESPNDATADSSTQSESASTGQVNPDTREQPMTASTMTAEGGETLPAGQRGQGEEEQPVQRARAQQAQQQQQAQQAESEAEQAEQETSRELGAAQQAQKEALQAEQETLNSSCQGLEEVRQALQKQQGMLMQLPLGSKTSAIAAGLSVCL